MLSESLSSCVLVCLKVSAGGGCVLGCASKVLVR